MLCRTKSLTLSYTPVIHQLAMEFNKNFMHILCIILVFNFLNYIHKELSMFLGFIIISRLTGPILLNNTEVEE